MIRVERRPAPDSFHAWVREPGRAFLEQHPHPTGRQFASHSYWRRVGRHLYEAYGGICAYSCHWIPLDTGSDTVEHFVPKSVEPSLAYEWDNYRLVCGRLNGRKGAHQDVLDPFEIANGAFALDFPSLLVKPGSAAETALQKEAVEATIRRLKLNDDETSLRARWTYVKSYCEQAITFRFLGSRAPFIAMELQRQNLVESIASIMGLSQEASEDR